MNTSLADRPAPSTERRERLVATGVVEEAWNVDCVGDSLMGVLSTPASDVASTNTAVVIVVGGPQYRVGAHRQFVQLARALAGDGHTVLRFDQRGMGDSSGTQRKFEDIGDDILAAIGAVRARLPSIQRLVLFGLCDGAAAALLFLQRSDAPQIDGVCLLNPWVRSEATLARTHLKHYYGRRLIDPAFWRKILAGGVGAGQWRDFMSSWRLSRVASTRLPADPALTFQQAMALAWRRHRGTLLLLLSDDDLTAREFIEHAQTSTDWRGLLDLPTVHRVSISGADHTLSTPQSQAACEETLRSWLAASGSAVSGVER